MRCKMQKINIKPAHDKTIFDEQGQLLQGSKIVPLNEFWARRLSQGDVFEIAEVPAEQFNKDNSNSEITDAPPAENDIAEKKKGKK